MVVVSHFQHEFVQLVRCAAVALYRSEGRVEEWKGRGDDRSRKEERKENR